MSEWQEQRLENLVSFQRGHDLPKVEMSGDGYPVAGSNGIIGYHKDFTCNGPGLTIGRSGNIGTPHFYNSNFWAHNTVLYAKQFHGNNPKFVYYCLKTLDFSQFNSGSAVPTLNRNHIHSLLIRFPHRHIQDEIAEVLSSLDDKIGLLHRENSTIKRMVELFFEEWILASSNRKWQAGQTHLLGELIDSISITHPLTCNQIFFLNTSDVYDGFVVNRVLSDAKGLPGQAKKRIAKHDILFSEIRPANRRFAYIDFDADDYVVSTKLMVLRSKGIIPSSFLYFYLTHPQTLQWLQMIAESRSGTFPQITFEQVKDMTINLPDVERLEGLCNWTDSMIAKLCFNHDQILTLQNLLNTLLPRLMSGEVRIISKTQTH